MNKSNVPHVVRVAAQRVVTLRAFRAPQVKQQDARDHLQLSLAVWHARRPESYAAAMSDLRRRAAL